MGTVAQLKKDDMPHGEANLKTNGDVEHLAPEQELSLMVTADKKVSETITISKGTMWLIGIVPAFVLLALYFVGIAIGWARDDTSKSNNIQQVQNDQRELNTKIESLTDEIKDLNRKMNERELKDARIEGYKLSQMEAEQNKK